MAGIYTELKGPAQDAYNQMVNKLVGKAKTELSLSDQDIIVRMLCPEDLQMANESSAYKYMWMFTLSSTGATANTLINNRTLADNRFTGVYGVCIPNANGVTQLEFTRKGSLARKWNVQVAPNQDDKTVYFDDPVTFDQNTTFTLTAYSSSALNVAGQHVIPLGVTVEKRGLTINP